MYRTQRGLTCWRGLVALRARVSCCVDHGDFVTDVERANVNGHAVKHPIA
jgi:hypothetical protein